MLFANCFFSRSRKRFVCLCIKIEKIFNTTSPSGTLGGQMSCTWTLSTSLVYRKLWYYNGHRSTQIVVPARRPAYAWAAKQQQRCLHAPTSLSARNNSHIVCILTWSPLKISSYAFRDDIDGDDIPLASPKRFMTRYLPRLDAGI